MAALLSMLASAGLIGLVSAYWTRFTQLPQSSVPGRFRIWLLRGLGVPLFIAFVLNLGVIPGVPPIFTPIAAARAATADIWTGYFVGAFVAVTWWAAISLAWILRVNLNQFPRSRRSLGMVLPAAVIAFLPAGVVAGSTEWLGVGFAISLWLIPIVHAFIKVMPKVHSSPCYKSVLTKLKDGQIVGAEGEALAQLEKAPADFQGWLLLAEIYAEHYRDLAMARETVFATCEQKNVTWAEISIARHRLADWHMEIEQDAESARQALYAICERMPGTYLAQLAQQRLVRLPHQFTRSTPVASAVENPLDDSRSTSGPKLSAEAAARRMNECLTRLQLNSSDIAALEEVARLYSDHLGRGDLGIRHLETLLEMPGQPAHKIMEWLIMLSQWHEQHRKDSKASHQALRRITSLYPQSVQAFAALRKLTLAPRSV